MKNVKLCDACNNEATVSGVLDIYMEERFDLCEDCHTELFTSVANYGKDFFYQWAMENYQNEQRAMKLTEIIFGEDAEVEDLRGKTMWLFTFGILKYPHNIEREGGKNIVENSTVRGHKMHLYNNSFPITRKTDNDEDVIYGTLFEVPLSTVYYRYDSIEGYDPKRPAQQNMYNRIKVDVTRPDGTVQQAEMYYANQDQFKYSLTDYTLIPSGNYDNRYEAKSYRPARTKNKRKKG